ncbi:N-Acetyl-D-glucosamine ABC transport system, permease protein 1 [Serinicoccus hydrothermalis]|uniref:N-Acetyl-D-glucosamine ABC transport system, permease protein 1 n=1 Tax=Serinicoccus hydrothermalis TaxID=1758689 RepID=A0A1B1N973_9MICO|nr:sugar ABC transporter permease [Serinicoccus hydrothermalis]ANS77966.1 N-Acetyl-D-glucosamine ABC transport system, permease protein 1 [Serinicoccus hydrothermalis]
MTARAREALAGYSFAAPTLLLLGVFVLLPLGGAMAISLQETNGFGEGTFVGLDNYRRLVQDPVFWRATVNTALYTVLVTPAAMAIGLGLALLLNSALPARGLLRSVLILPMAISGVATALMGVLIFDENSGFLTEAARVLGLPQIDWQTHGPAAFASVVIMTLWWRVGFNMLIYLAGLQGISHELHEAARLDGANSWQRLLHVTVPQLKPQSFFLVILNIIYSFQVFDIVFVMTGGGPERATTVLVTYAYDTGFVTRDQGYAAAIGVVLLAVTLVVTGLRWRAERRREETE